MSRVPLDGGLRVLLGVISGVFPDLVVILEAIDSGIDWLLSNSELGSSHF